MLAEEQTAISAGADPRNTLLRTALPDGRAFTGFAELNALLAADEEALARAFVAHLSRYATGAEVGYADRAEIGRIVAKAKEKSYGLRSLIQGLAASRIFTE